jgi:hypothetical protein
MKDTLKEIKQIDFWVYICYLGTILPTIIFSFFSISDPFLLWFLIVPFISFILFLIRLSNIKNCLNSGIELETIVEKFKKTYDKHGREVGVRVYYSYEINGKIYNSGYTIVKPTRPYLFNYSYTDFQIIGLKIVILINRTNNKFSIVKKIYE